MNSASFELRRGSASLHVTLHFGERWDDEGSEAFDEVVSEWFDRFGWQAFAASDNSSLLVQSDD